MPVQDLWELVLYALLVILPLLAIAFMLLALATGLPATEAASEEPDPRPDGDLVGAERAVADRTPRRLGGG